jgi:hypothetical protein
VFGYGAQSEFVVHPGKQWFWLSIAKTHWFAMPAVSVPHSVDPAFAQTSSHQLPMHVPCEQSESSEHGSPMSPPDGAQISPVAPFAMGWQNVCG